MDEIYSLRQGSSPVILAMPHTGKDVPADIIDRLNANGQLLADTDWHIDQLYAGLLPRATLLSARFHRFVIDANRDPSGVSLYPGQNTTGLVPLTDFDGQPIWRNGREPTESDISERLARFHAPYHAALRAEIERVKAIHGLAVVYDCHSIRSVIPYLFDGVLPDFNIGTDMGRTADPVLAQAVIDSIAAAPGWRHVVNGRFKGGWTTRHYGQPETGVHAIQMELAQLTHLTSEAPPFAYDAAKAAHLRPILQSALTRLEEAALQLSERLVP